jgi:hypothetical protein
MWERLTLTFFSKPKQFSKRYLAALDVNFANRGCRFIKQLDDECQKKLIQVPIAFWLIVKKKDE